MNQPDSDLNLDLIWGGVARHGQTLAARVLEAMSWRNSRAQGTVRSLSFGGFP